MITIFVTTWLLVMNPGSRESIAVGNIASFDECVTLGNNILKDHYFTFHCYPYPTKVMVKK